MTKKIYYYSETHLRFRNSLDNNMSFVGRMGQIYNRHGVNFLFNKHFEFTIGPTLVFNYTPEPGNPDFEKVVLEPRVWHQWLFIMPYMGRVKLYHQFRFEHRFKRDNNVGAPFQYTDRYRYKIFAYIPLNKPTLGNKTLFIAPSAEIFLHSGKSIVANPMEDFRVYTGLGYILNNNVTFFGGHMWTLGQGRNPAGFQYGQNHIIRLNVFLTFDLRKRTKRIDEIRLTD